MFPFPVCAIRSVAALFLLLFQAAAVRSDQETANARLWQREVESDKGVFFDSSSPHPLSCFTADPFLRDDGNEFCADCRPEGKAQLHKQHRFKTELKPIGSIRDFVAEDLFYYFDDGIEARKVGWKSILVRNGPDRFREIYHLQTTSVEMKPSYFIDTGTPRFWQPKMSLLGLGMRVPNRIGGSAVRVRSGSTPAKRFLRPWTSYFHAGSEFGRAAV